MLTACFLTLLLGCLAAQEQGAEPLEIIPDAPVIPIEDFGLYRIGYVLRGHSEEHFPLGWPGPADDRTGVVYQPVGLVDGQQAVFVHCPWKIGTGFTFQELVVRIPASGRTVLRGFTRLRHEALGKSDGVTFRIRVGSRVVLNVHRTDGVWKEFSIDLTPFAGKALSLRFEADAGPKDNSAYDYALWGGRQLVCDGVTAHTFAHPPAPQVPLASLLARQSGGTLPAVDAGLPAQPKPVPEGNAMVFRSNGLDGYLEYRWQKPEGRGPENFFGAIELSATRKGAPPVRLRVGRGAEIRWTGTAQPSEAHWDTSSATPTLVRTLQVGDRTATVHIVGSLHGKSLVLDVDADQPLAERLDPGVWGPVQRRRAIPTPFLSNPVHYLPAEGLFVTTTLDWTQSAATGLDEGIATYQALTNGSRNLLHERVVFTAAWNLDEVYPNIPNPPSPSIKDLSSRTVLDIWGGRYQDIAERLDVLASYGVQGGVAIIHDWQRSGYDNALPAHYPAAANKGGDEGMRVLVATGKRLGYLVPLHENYVDYYPNYEGFSESDIALDSSGKRQNAWYNEGTKIQSFAIQPNAILPLAASQSPEIHRRYATNANYLDVHSAVPPWFHVDQRAGETGAGRFRRVWDIHRELWNYERKTHGGPVFGEGNNHWYWSGCLDGVEAQFGQGWAGGEGRQAPLLVDFDLLKIHPLQLNHGMGYYDRWWGKSTWDGAAPLVVLDQYRMQEVAFGHQGFVGSSSWAEIPPVWLEHHLLAPVTARYAAARPAEIRYDLRGTWVDASTAAAGDESLRAFQRVRIRYDNGLTITANQAGEPLRVGTHVLPQYGWIADGAGVSAGTTSRNGVVSDYAETADSVFANARPAREWNLRGTLLVQPEIEHFQVIGPRTIRASYAWHVKGPVPRDFLCFVHFFKQGAPGAEILFQQDHALATPCSRWRAGQKLQDGPHDFAIPPGLPDGEYRWTIGLFTPTSGRAAMEGVQDGDSRILLGTLKVSDHGRKLTLVREKNPVDDPHAIYLEHVNSNNALVDFGPIRTDGSVVIRRAGERWTAWVFPRDREFTLLLDPRRFGRPDSISCDGGKLSVAPSPSTDGTCWKLPLNGSARYEWSSRQ